MAERTAVVTGASGGIGEEFAKQLAAAGWAVTAVARTEDKLKQLVAGLPGQGHRTVVADLSTQEGIAAVQKELDARHPQLLVNNAGVGVYGRFEKSALPKLESMMHLNVDALYKLSHSFLSQAKEGDALVNVASTLGLMSFPGAALYSATKAFVVSLSESLWFEWKDRGVYVMGLCPGVTKTSFHTQSGGTADNKPPEAISQTAEEVVRVALAKLERRSSPTVVSGAINNAMVFASRLLSRKAMVKVMGGNAPKGALD